MSAGIKHTHATGVEQSTDNRTRRKKEDLFKIPLILWEIGEEGEIDDTQAQLREAARRADKRGLFERGDDR